MQRGIGLCAITSISLSGCTDHGAASVEHEIAAVRFAEKQDLQSAEREYRAAIKESVSESDKLKQARLLHELGKLLGKEKNYDESIERLKESLELYDPLGTASGGEMKRRILAAQSSVYASLARIYVKQKDMEQARDAYKKALELQKEGLGTIESQLSLNDEYLQFIEASGTEQPEAVGTKKRSMLLAMNNWSEIYFESISLFHQDKLKQAQQQMDIAYGIVRDKNNLHGLLATQGMMGLYRIRDRQYKDAEHWLNQSLMVQIPESQHNVNYGSETLQRRVWLSYCQDKLGKASFSQAFEKLARVNPKIALDSLGYLVAVEERQKPKSSIKTMLEGFKLCDRFHLTGLQAASSYQSAADFFALNRKTWSIAEKSFLEVPVCLAHEPNSRESIHINASSHHNLALLYSNQDRYEEAKEQHLEEFSVFLRSGIPAQRRRAIDALKFAAECELKKRNGAAVDALFAKGLEQMEKLPAQSQDLLEANTVAGEMCVRAGDLSAAQSYFMRGIALLGDIKGVEKNRLLGDARELALVLLNKKRSVEGEKIMQELVKHSPKRDLPFDYSCLSTMLIVNKKYTEAESCARRALATAESRRALVNSESLRAPASAETLTKKIDTDTVQALHNLGDSLNLQKKHKEGLECFERAVAIKSKLTPGGDRELGYMLHTIGNLKSLFKEYPAAEQAYLKALPMLKSIDLPEVKEETAWLYQRLSQAQLRLEKYAEADKNCQMSLLCFRNLKLRDATADKEIARLKKEIAVARAR